MVSNFSAKYYQKKKNQSKITKKIRIRYQNLSEEEKEKQQEHSRDRYKILPEHEMQMLFEYRKNVIKCRKTLCNICNALFLKVLSWCFILFLVGSPYKRLLLSM